MRRTYKETREPEDMDYRPMRIGGVTVAFVRCAELQNDKEVKDEDGSQGH